MQFPRFAKQASGALAGAALAFVLYQGYSFTSLKLQGLVTLPVAPGVNQQDTTRFATTTEDPLDDRYLGRINRRIQEIYSLFGPTPVTEQTSSAQPTAWENFRAPFDRYRRLSYTASSSSAMAATTVTAPVIPVGPAGGPINGVAQVVGAPVVAVPAVMPPTVVSPWATEPQVAVPVHVTVTPEPSLGEHTPEPGTSVAAQVEARRQERLADLTPPDLDPPTKLPKSGFGIDDLAMMAVGGAIAQRYMKKKKAA